MLAYSISPSPTYSQLNKSYNKSYQEGRQIHFYEKGEEIPLLDQGVWQIYRGFVELGTLHPNGEETLLGWGKPQSFFGKWLNRLHAYRAIALSDVYLIWYSLKEIETSSPIAHTMLNQVIQGMRQTETLLAIVGMKRVEERLEAFLNFLGTELGEPVAQGIQIQVRLTHQNIATSINTTRVTTTKILGEWQRQGKIEWTEDRHLILI